MEDSEKLEVLQRKLECGVRHAYNDFLQLTMCVDSTPIAVNIAYYRFIELYECLSIMNQNTKDDSSYHTVRNKLNCWYKDYDKLKTEKKEIDITDSILEIACNLDNELEEDRNKRIDKWVEDSMEAHKRDQRSRLHHN